MKKKRVDPMENVEMTEFDIFGEHKSREQVKAEEKARKAAEREAMREVAHSRRAAVREKNPVQKGDIITLVVIVVMIVAMGVGALLLQFSRAEQAKTYLRDEDRSYFKVTDAVPEMSEEGMSVAVSQVYYTYGGYLCVEMVLGNGTDTALRLDAIDVVLINGDEATIAGGYAETSGELVVAPDATENYTFYISPEHIYLKDDSLTKVGYTINATTTEVEATTTE